MINIAKQIFVGKYIGTSNSLPLMEAEIIPMGDSANEQRKIKKSTEKYDILYEHDNVPLPGFTLYKVNRKRYGSADQTWLVIDPRGFLCRITNDNLEDILTISGITEGLIQERCLWVRNNSQTSMTLMPVNSPEYQTILENTELIENKIDIKDVQIGDEVFLQNGLTGTYMGVMSLYTGASDHSSYSGDKMITAHKYLRRQVVRVSPGIYHYQTNVKILKIVKKTQSPMSRIDSVNFVNSEINKTTYFTDSSDIVPGRFYKNRIRFVSCAAVKDVTFSRCPVDKDTAMEIYLDSMKDSTIGDLLLEDSNGKLFVVNHPYFPSSSSTGPVIEFGVCDVEIFIDDSPNFKLSTKRTFFRNQGNVYTFDDFTTYYRITKQVKNETYN
jgi:hypothetical protein